MMRRRSFLSAVPLAAWGLPALAQADFPSRPVRLVVPFAPAGAADILGRLLAEHMAPLLGQPVVVENRAGASGHIGAQAVATSPADGHTLVVGTIGIHAAHGAYRKLTYNPATDLAAVTVLGESANVVVVPAASPWRSLADLTAEARAKPGVITYGTAGPGSSVHMVTALYELMAGVRMNHVPYRGSGPALTDLIGAQIQVMFDNLSSAMPHVQSGKLRALAVTGARREKSLPDVPTIAEAGVPGYAAGSWFTLAAPRGTPAAITERLQRDARRALAVPEAASRLEALGIQPVLGTPAETAAFFSSETEKWGRVIRAANLQLD